MSGLPLANNPYKTEKGHDRRRESDTGFDYHGCVEENRVISNPEELRIQ